MVGLELLEVLQDAAEAFCRGNRVPVLGDARFKGSTAERFVKVDAVERLRDVLVREADVVMRRQRQACFHCQRRRWKSRTG